MRENANDVKINKMEFKFNWPNGYFQGPKFLVISQ